MDKIYVPATFAAIHPDDGIQNAISTLESAQEAVSSGEWICLSIESYSDGDYTSPSWYIRGERLETDKEYSLRMKQEEKDKLRKQKTKEQQRERERKEYERLKKKFEKDNPTC